MSRIHYLIIVCVILPYTTSTCSLETSRSFFSRSVYEFSANLLRRIAVEKEGHFIASTLSPYALLSSISFGAAGKTLAEIKEVLRHKGYTCYTNKYMQLANQVLTSEDGATLERSGVVFVDDNFEMNKGFKSTLTRHRVDITPVSFANFVAAAAQINDFVKQATHGIIDELVAPADLQDVYLMMVDALYFKGSWRRPFDVENTMPSPFYDSTGSVETGEVNMMFTRDDFNVTNLTPFQATVLELPYGNSNKFSMLVFLPNEGVDLMTVIDNLKTISLRSVFRMYEIKGQQKVNVQIPRFKITSDLSNLKELLRDMGLKSMFDPAEAKFPGISDYELYVSSFVQKADIEVTEEGTVGAAVTDLGVSFRSTMVTEPEFIANKPFLYMVVDRQNEVAVLTGAYSKPALY